MCLWVEKEAFRIGIQSDTMCGSCWLCGLLTNLLQCRKDIHTTQKIFIKQNVIKIVIMRGASDTPCSTAQQKYI
jgi:hypothetical protein